MRMLKNSHTGLFSFSIIFILFFTTSLQAFEFKLGSKIDYQNGVSKVVYSSKNASYVAKVNDSYAFIINGRRSELYKEIEMLVYGDSKNTYAYIGIDRRDYQNIVHNGRKIRHTMDNIISLSTSDKAMMYVGQKDDTYFLYLNTKKVLETENELSSVLLLENGNYLLSMKDGNSYKIFLGNKEIATSELPAEFHKHKKYIVVVHSSSKSANAKSISICDNYKDLENFKMTTLNGFNRFGSMETSGNQKSYVIEAYKTTSTNPTIIANGKVLTDATKLNHVIFSPNGLRYLVDIRKSDGSYIIGDDDQFGPYSDAIVDMSFSLDSRQWGFLGKNGSRTILIIDSEAITSYPYASNVVLLKTGSQWLVAAASGGEYFLDFYNTAKYEPTKTHANRVYYMSMSSNGRIGFIFDDEDGTTRININNEVLDYEASSKYPFIAVTDKGYMSIIDDDDEYAIVLNGKVVAKFDELYGKPIYYYETSEVSMVYLEDDEVFSYRTTIK